MAKKYALNLKREFPRIPYYQDFWKWAKWGEKLMQLHIGYETIEPWPLKRIDTPDEQSRRAGLRPGRCSEPTRRPGIFISIAKRSWQTCRCRRGLTSLEPARRWNGFSTSSTQTLEIRQNGKFQYETVSLAWPSSRRPITEWRAILLRGIRRRGHDGSMFRDLQLPT
jgi:hypothetical protein